MRDPFAFIVVSFLSGQRQQPFSIQTRSCTSHTQLQYSLMPHVWKFLEQKQDTLIAEEEKMPIDNTEIMVGRPIPSESDSRSWYRSAYPEMFQSSIYNDFAQDLWTDGDDSIVGVMKYPTTIGSIRPWCGTKYYSDLIMDGVHWLSTGLSNDNMIMMLESPTSSTSQQSYASSSSSKASFLNKLKFTNHDYPPSGLEGKTILGPLRYACMTGHAFHTFLRNPAPPGLVDHWKHAIPNLNPPTFTTTIPSKSKTICAYLPLERFVHQHLIDPYIHHELCGKDCIPHMTTRTTKLLSNTHTVRPCVVKVTHAMGSRGIFIIRNDEDEVECFQCLQQTGQPDYVVTEFVDIRRSLAAHFFIHPSGDITWFGTSENVRQPSANGRCSDDATIWNMKQQETLRKLMTP